MLKETEVALRAFRRKTDWKIPVSLFIFFCAFVLFCGCAHHAKRTHDDLIRYGIELAEKGYWTEAAVQWRRVLEEDPENAAALNNLGVAAEIESHPEDARKLLSAALNLRPDSQRIKQNLVSIREREEKESSREKTDEDME